MKAFYFMKRTVPSAVVLCLDVGFSMSKSAPGEEPPFEQAKKVIQMYVQRQVFADNKDELALVLFGSDETNTALASDGQYQNIFVHRHLMLPDFNLLEEIQSDIQPGAQQTDFLDALVVCMDLLQKETLGKKYEKLHIAIFTDLCSSCSSDHLDIIVDYLKKGGISLQFFLPFPLDIEGESRGREDAAAGPGQPPYSRKGLTQKQKEGLEMVRKVMTSLDEEEGLDEVHTFSASMEQLSIFKKIERRPLAWPCQLTIGSSLTIRIVGYKAVTEEKMKKSWEVVDARTQRKDVQRETVFCLNDDNETEVPMDDTIQGFRYGSDIVPFSKVDQEQMKYKSDGKCFSVLGFTKQSQVIRHHFMGNQVIKVFAARDDKHAAVALSSLIHALDELEMVAIVRYAYNRCSYPQVGAAFPCIQDKYECLMYVQLPYMEDLRQFTFSSLQNNKKYIPSGEQMAVVDSLIDSMMLVKGEGEEMEDLFEVSSIPNPEFQRLFQCLHHRALNPSAPLPPPEPWLKGMLERPQKVTARCTAPLQQLRQRFPLQEAVRKKEQKTAQDIFGDVNEEEPSSKKARQYEDEKFNLAGLTEGFVTAVGSVDPGRDFRVLMRQKSLPFGQVCQQLTSRVDQLLGTKGTQYYMKSISCIQAFREESSKAGDVEPYNSYLQTLKKSVQERPLQDFWELLVQDNITLISKDEVEGSTVSKTEANQFLAPEQKPDEQTAPSADDGGDVDDLLDMM
ncbi:X-ray repair cross-complementing protein 5-like isoform X1 [Acipenser oxyrinchus oxyrinchus]|uniref:X-ray repair cross-complementing protein 5 n=1 Tax=Acipenser oxyrinchus oxyrinchus TaxID=40147 RepID=A0AAD8G2H1_ACIOX|nr:X-ray repair cross-complementing protein 5-like isoform X1 [Acipenser oxyrinchus oxyrinchus]